MITATRPHGLLRSTRAVATLALAILLTMGTAACSTTTPTVASYAAATHGDPKFENTFQHNFADVDGVRMHYVTGGHGTPVVLIHGWPQSWYGWWPIMPALHTPLGTHVALDLTATSVSIRAADEKQDCEERL
ncbi:alpha/beta hydrolase [Nocardia sp. NPDC101769]|uniref:alpha/beta fold hydrolase n=1 Tax=Nocardia sp. NPDC101769 TaxID=3364333 RepID=UPI0037F547C2